MKAKASKKQKVESDKEDASRKNSHWAKPDAEKLKALVQLGFSAEQIAASNFFRDRSLDSISAKIGRMTKNNEIGPLPTATQVNPKIPLGINNLLLFLLNFPSGNGGCRQGPGKSGT